MRRFLICLFVLGIITPAVYFGVIYSTVTDTEAGPPGPIGNGDVNGDGSINIGDPVYLLGFLFDGGPAPVAIAGGPSCECDAGLFRISDPAGGPATLAFGRTDECTIGIDPALPGLTESDPTGFRLLGPGGQGCRLIFGDTMDCTVEVDPTGPSGLLLRDLEGIRIMNPDPLLPTRLRFGRTDECTIGIDPNLPGLTESDPVGFRLLGPGGQGCRLIFGDTMDCTVEVDPTGPSGLLLRDLEGIRIMNPDSSLPSRLRFGRTDDCTIGIDPSLPGLTESDPIGFRLLGQGGQGCRLIFGDTMDCTIEVDPAGPPGIQLRDPEGIRVMNPDPGGLARLAFGPTDECTISVNPSSGQGMQLTDPAGFFFEGGPVFATEFIPLSAGKYKENVRPIQDALDKIQALNGVMFEWKGKLGGKTDIGFLAEDVAGIVPEVVAHDDKGDARGVSYDHLVALAVEGIKAQQSMIENLTVEKTSLEGEVSTLKSQNDTLNQRLERLEALVEKMASSDK